MKAYTIIKISEMWSTDNLRLKVEQLLNDKTRDGYTVESVSFGTNLWYMPTAFITLSK